MSGRIVANARRRVLAVASLAVSAASAVPAFAADAAPSRHCVLLAAEYETQGPSARESTDALRANTRLVQEKLLQRMASDRVVANTIFVDLDNRAAIADKVGRTRTITGCDAVVELRHVFLASSLGGAFGFDVIVDQARGDASIPVFSQQYRYRADNATIKRFSFDGFADQAWADLRQAGMLDGDRETAAVSPTAVRAEYDRFVAAWPTTLREYHLRYIVRSTAELANATLARLHEPDPPEFGVLAGIESDDPSGALRGGDAGWRPLSSMPPELAQAVQARDSSGGLIDVPIYANNRWNVVEVLGSRPAQPPSFDSVREQIAARLRWDAVVPAAVSKAALQP